MAEINQQNQVIPQLVMSYELGTKYASVYRASLCDWFVFLWEGDKVKIIQCVCAQQALDVFDRCLGEKAEA